MSIGFSIDTLPNGGVHVRNSPIGSWGQEPWTLVEELRIGSVHASGPALFGEVAGIEVDGYSRIHALERHAKEIRVFDSTGSHIRTYARQGGGPGELKDPIGIVSGPDEELWIVDPGNGRYAVFDSAGNFQRSYPRRIGTYSVPWTGGFDGAGNLYEIVTLFVRQEGGFQTRHAVLRFDDQLQIRDTLLLPVHNNETFTLENSSSQISATVPFTPEIVYAVSPDGDPWVAVNDEFKVAKLKPDGDTLLLIERKYEFIPVTGEEREEAIADLEWFTRQGGRVDAARIPDTKPAFSRFAVDLKGRLWVVPNASQESGTLFDVFDAGGRYLGRLHSPAAFWPRPLFRGDYLYGQDVDSLGVTYIVRARIVR
ncbi:MAG: hypothetical protein ACREMD_11610 [Gemmatimonadota bacterium]